MTSHDDGFIHARDLLYTSSSSVKAVNRRKIIRAVMAQPDTQVRIARRIELSQATVSTVVHDLQREKIVAIDDVDSERNRRVHIHAVRGAAVGLEVGHNRLTVAVRRVNSEERLVDSDLSGASFGIDVWLPRAKNLIKEMVRKAGLTPADVVSIGIGIPAAVDPRTGRITQVSPSLAWDLDGAPHEWFTDEFPRVPVVPDNEANFAAFGEYLHGAGRDVETLLFIKASSGVGSGIVINGKIFRGRHGLAGEIGHLSMDSNGTLCNCGGRGCLETLVGGPQLLKQVRKAYAGHRVHLPETLNQLVERVISGRDRVSLRVVQEAAWNIGLAVAQASNLINPDLVVLGGELGRAGHLVVGPAQAALEMNALEGAVRRDAPVEITQSPLGLTAGAAGALSFALITERYEL